MAILPIDGRRYGSEQMTAIFEEDAKVGYQLAVEGAVAVSQAELGLVPHAAGRDIYRASRSGRITARRIRELEAVTDHDTAALVQALSEKCSKASRPWVHYGLTSNDLVDTSSSLQMRDALDIIVPKIARLARLLSARAVRYSDLPAVGRTHGQHASIISFGSKFANWAFEMALHLQRIDQLKKRVLVCKTLGVVGTGSLMGSKALEVQAAAARRLGLVPAEIATQVVPRERYAEYVFGLALVGTTIEKMAVEIRNLQRTEIGEVAERFGAGQMGSSAVPVKRNPIKSERVGSLARILRSQLQVSFENIPLWHERDLTNSANERFILPTSAILLDEMLDAGAGIIKGLVVNKKRIRQNLSITGGQIFAEFVLKALIEKGMPRLEAYRHVQRIAFATASDGTDYISAVTSDSAVSSRLSRSELEAIFVPERHLGASSRMIRRVDNMVQRTVGKL